MFLLLMIILLNNEPKYGAQVYSTALDCMEAKEIITQNAIEGGAQIIRAECIAIPKPA